VAHLLTPSRRLGATVLAGAAALGSIGACGFPGGPFNGAAFQINEANPLEIQALLAAPVDTLIEIENIGTGPASVSIDSEGDTPVSYDNCNGQVLPGNTCEITVTIAANAVPNGEDDGSVTLTVSPSGNPASSATIELVILAVV
jgi:hypothetical protein